MPPVSISTPNLTLHSSNRKISNVNLDRLKNAKQLAEKAIKVNFLYSVNFKGVIPAFTFIFTF